MSQHLDLADWRRHVAALYLAMRIDGRAAPLRPVSPGIGKNRRFAEHRLAVRIWAGERLEPAA